LLAPTVRFTLALHDALPICQLAQLLDLDGQVVGPGPVGVPARGALVDPLRQVAHAGDAGADLLAQQHAAAARHAAGPEDQRPRRAEEHTSALQSHLTLVRRL